MKKINIEYSENSPLISAEPEKREYAPVTGLLLAVAWMFLSCCIVAGAALLLLKAAGKDISVYAMRLIAGVAFFGAAVVILTVINNKKAREYEKRQKELLENAKKYRGTVIGCERITDKTVYANTMYSEITWRFIVEYFDEGGKRETVKSGRYLNDLSCILKSADVDVFVKEDGSTAFGEFGIRSGSSDGISLPITYTEDKE